MAGRCSHHTLKHRIQYMYATSYKALQGDRLLMRSDMCESSSILTGTCSSHTLKHKNMNSIPLIESQGTGLKCTKFEFWLMLLDGMRFKYGHQRPKSPN